MKWGIVLAIFGMAAILAIPPSMLQANAVDVVGNVNIIAGATCTVTVVGGPLTFDISGVGLSNNGADSDEEIVTLTNTGTATASVRQLASADWENGGDPKMDRGQTAWDTGAGTTTWASKTPLTSTDVTVVAALTGTAVQVNYQTQPVLQGGDEFFTGALDLTSIVVTFSCP